MKNEVHSQKKSGRFTNYFIAVYLYQFRRHVHITQDEAVMSPAFNPTKSGV